MGEFDRSIDDPAAFGTREALAIEVGRSFTAQEVMLTPQFPFAVRGAPEHVRSETRPEFIAGNIQGWIHRAVANTRSRSRLL